jgi:hypothetical protein
MKLVFQSEKYVFELCGIFVQQNSSRFFGGNAGKIQENAPTAIIHHVAMQHF